jgi:hypothetical protein
MALALPFELTDTPNTRADARCVVLPSGIRSVPELLQAWYERLLLPGYFGFNWDALSDCLRDLHWVDEREVLVHHMDLPALSDDELCTYLEVLAESITSWGDADPHRLVVSFPVGAQARLQACFRSVAGA